MKIVLISGKEMPYLYGGVFMTNFIGLSNNFCSNPHRSTEHPFQARMVSRREIPSGKCNYFRLADKEQMLQSQECFSTGANLFVGAWLEGPDPLLSLGRVLSVFCIRLFSFVS